MSSSDRLYTGEAASDPGDFQRFCHEVLQRYRESEDILRASRNTLKKIDLDGEPCVVKAFKVPTFPQNFSYGLLSDSKAKKSFVNAGRLIDMGFHSPLPVAYLETRQRGKLTDSYYLCGYTEAPTMVEYTKKPDQITDDLISGFAQLCVDLHRKGVLHRDFNPLNILVEDKGARPAFSLVDINRVSWYQKPLSLTAAMQAMSRLYFPAGMEEQVLARYAQLSGLDLSACQSALRRQKEKTQRYFRNKGKLRKIFPRK